MKDEMDRRGSGRDSPRIVTGDGAIRLFGQIIVGEKGHRRPRRPVVFDEADFVPALVEAVGEPLGAQRFLVILHHWTPRLPPGALARREAL
jgi:hypothetical protein